MSSSTMVSGGLGSTRQAIRAAMGATIPRRWFMLDGPSDSGSVALTFDDGPHKEHTARILDVLRRFGVSATFFVVGNNVRQQPSLVRRILDEGHEIGHHSYSHSCPTGTSALMMAAEIRRTNQLLWDVAAIKPRLFRPPHGKLTPGKLLASWCNGCTVTLWNVDTKDYAQPDVAAIKKRLENSVFAAGDLVLLHDTCPHTPEALEWLISVVRESNLRFVRVSEWLQ